MTDAPRAATQTEIRAAQLFEKLFKDPELGVAIRQRAKAEFPDIVIPEDTLTPLVTPLQKQLETMAKTQQELIDKLAKRENEDLERSMLDSMKSRVDAAVAKFSFTEEGRAKLLKLMEESGNFNNPEQAAALIAHTNPKPAALPTWATTNLDFLGSKDYDEKMAQLHRNPQAYEDAELLEFAKNPDKYVAETFGQAA
jgi:hypothetical protein